MSTNRLKAQKSAYLKQHQNNPVNWWPWGPEAITAAVEENKPIFLSIGYSTCHWCHVMAHESFEDHETAEILNKKFIAIKVDKEEFPDIDHYYQQACQLFTRSGGWPLSAFLRPDLAPFFVGTYFPKEGTQDRPGLKEILLEMDRAFHNERSRVDENAKQVSETLAKGLIPEGKVDFQGHFPHPSAICEAIKEYMDVEFGGFGKEPKFPQFSYYLWSVEQMLEGMIDGNPANHTIKTIESMLFGGIYDQVRGGIHRYSTDQEWLVPHFEKMLYDQAGMLSLLAKTSILFGAPEVYDSMIQTIEYLDAEMSFEEGHFFSAQDADSEGVEGLYHCFTHSEFEDALNTHDSEEEILQKKRSEIIKWFGISEKGNFERSLNVVSLGSRYKEEFLTQENWPVVRFVKAALLEERKLRIPPLTDNKGVASWNFNLLSSLIDVAQYCKIEVISKMAMDLYNKMLGPVLKTFTNFHEMSERNIQIKHSTTLDSQHALFEDYSFFAELLLRSYEISGDQNFKQKLDLLVPYILKNFVRDNSFTTRMVSDDGIQLYPNQLVDPYDLSFKSPASTFILTVKRYAVLTLNRDILKEYSEIFYKHTNSVLKQPLSAGEGLRALTYPDLVFRCLKVPRSWSKTKVFRDFTSNLLTRFVVDYHDREDESWQVCNLEVCELSGKSLNELIETLSGTKEE
ncbi:MAG: thioredoxin domain-containing protein [Halobacteriovoraceae bacterium]|nr:thioredoxin domain-containing protein [Halobacteriovoraceae bacterium]